MPQILFLLQNRFVEIPSGEYRHCWHLTKTNWIVSSEGNRLIWVPEEAQVAEPSNTLVISRHGFGSLDLRQAMVGDEWTGCYTP